MSRKILIENIEPFNDLYFKNCFYNSFFPIIKYLGKAIEPFIINEVPVYELNNHILNTKYIEEKDIISLLKEEGIKYEITFTSEDIIEEIIQCISKSMPVILQIDCFYESIKQELFLKSHWPHSLLIHGVDEERKVFNIIEQEYHENLSYRKTEIGFLDIINCYRGYLQNYQKGKEIITLYKFNISNNNDHGAINKSNEFLSDFITNRIKYKDSILLGVEKIIEYSNMISENTSSIVNNLETVISGLNNIIHTKKGEKYILDYILKDNVQVQSNIDSIINLWNKVRNTMIRSTLTHVFDESVAQKIISFLNEIYNFEKEYNEQLFQLAK